MKKNDAVLEGEKVGDFLDSTYARLRMEQFCPHIFVTKEGQTFSNFTVLAHGRSVTISAKTGKVSRVSLKARDWNGKVIVIVWQAVGTVTGSEPGAPVIRVQKIELAR